MRTTILIMLLLTAGACYAQQKDTPEPANEPVLPKNVEAKFEGMLAVSYGSDTFGINVGGPSLKYKFTKNFKIGVGAFPSLIIINGKALPRLAVSPIVEYKKFMAITPYYGFDAEDNPIWTFGIGYKFI